MKILEINPIPIHTTPYKVAAKRSKDIKGIRQMEDTYWPLLSGKVDSLPKNLDALLLASDLQGHIENNGKLSLLGIGLAEELALFLEIEYPHLSLDRIGVILCGDLFALPNKRGGLGDVRSVYWSFRKYFKWIAAVHGNHDSIGQNHTELQNFQQEENIYLLDGNSKKVDQLQISGLSGIIGSPKKINRRAEADFLQQLKKLLLQKHDLLLLHEGPDYYEDNFVGNPEIRAIIEQSKPSLVCCGHNHWKAPLHELANGTQVLNLEGRAVLLIDH